MCAAQMYKQRGSCSHTQKFQVQAHNSHYSHRGPMAAGWSLQFRCEMQPAGEASAVPPLPYHIASAGPVCHVQQQQRPRLLQLCRIVQGPPSQAFHAVGQSMMA